LQGNAFKQTTIYRSPILLLIIVASAIFVSEIIVMFLIPLPAISLPVAALIDSVLLVALLLPILYFSVFRQSSSQIAELLKVNEQLQTQITERNQAGMALRESEEKYRMLVETMNDGLVIVDENGTLTYVNDRLCDMLGRFPQDIIGHTAIEFTDEENQNILKEQMAKRKKGESGPYEIAWKRVGGEKISAIVSPKPIFGEDREFKGSFAIVTDITQQKQAEEVLKESEEQLRFLSSQLLTAQETERRRISRELHDELGQALAVLKLRTDFIKESLDKDRRKAREECERSLRYIDQVIENVRRLSRDLSPPVLQDVGLTAAIKWLVDNVTNNRQARVKLDIMEVDDLFSEDAKIMIYRIIQEALTNIVRYAEAKNVSVTIKKNGNAITFRIEDDGKGFNVVQAIAKDAVKRGLGLTTMDERVRILRGILDLRSEEGYGTQISFTIPSTNGHLSE
jgi:two-component system sensor histidine kinase UhpB